MKSGPFRIKIVEISTLAAEKFGGAKVCKTKCHYIKEGRPGRCCSECHKDYLTAEQRRIVKHELDIIASPETGYLGPTGCRLPRSHRPTLCLTYACETMERFAPRAVDKLLEVNELAFFARDKLGIYVHQWQGGWDL